MALNQLNGKQIRNGVIANAHIATGAAIAESKLDIGWSARYQAALESKKVLDYVQLNDLAVSEGAASLVIPTGVGAGKISLAYAATENDNGVTNTKMVIVRNHTTGTPIYVSGAEVWAELSYTAEVLDPQADAFYTITYKTGSFGSGTPVNLPDETPNLTAIDIQYPARFNLHSVPEDFAMNEKFVDGMADVTEIQNLKQLAKDLYGASWSLDNDGTANLATSLADEITTLKADVSTSGSVLYMIDTNVFDVLDDTTATSGASMIGIYDNGNYFTATTVEGALQEIMSDLAATTETSGAALIGVYDDVLDPIFTATTVQGILVELEGRIGTLETTGNQEIIDTHSRESDTPHNYFAATAGSPYTSLEDRLIAIETVTDTVGYSVDTLISDLSSTGMSAEDSGASMIGINDTQFTATTVEAALTEALDAAQAAQEDVDDLVTLTGVLVNAETMGEFTGTWLTDNQDIKELFQQIETDIQAVTDGAAGADRIGFTKGSAFTAETVQAVIEEIDTHIKATTDSASGADYVGVTTLTNRTGNTVQAVLEDIDTDLDVVEDWKTANATKIHVHSEEVSAVTEDTTEYTTTATFTVASDFIGVYVNGVRQLPTTHYTIAQGVDANATKAVITFLDTLVNGDNIYLEMVKYNS